MKKKVCAFTIADDNNKKYLSMMRSSLRRWHDADELPLIEIVNPELSNTLKVDPEFFYRATPTVAAQLIDSYETVIKIDADSIITAPINEAWEGDHDVKVVLNSNPREVKQYPVSVLDLHPVQQYVNCGFVAMRSKEFVEHWLQLCMSPHFHSYQFREQDLLNILVHYGNYNCELLDNGTGFWGLSSKGYWTDIQLKDDQLVLPANTEWNKSDKIIRVIHWAGGNTPNKMNVHVRFQEDVAKWLNNLTKPIA